MGRDGGTLSMAEGDSAFSEIVGREFQCDFIARQNANAIATQSARQMRQNDPFMFKLHAEQTAGELFQDRAGYFDAIFFTHTPLWGSQAGPKPGAGPRNSQAAVTLVACRPLGPLVTSNSTWEPSSSVR